VQCHSLKWVYIDLKPFPHDVEEEWKLGVSLYSQLASKPMSKLL